MTSRERVFKTLTFDHPDRVPRDLWALPGAQVDQKDEIAALVEKYPMDIGKPQTSPGTDEGMLEESIGVGTYVDELGSVWERAAYSWRRIHAIWQHFQLNASTSVAAAHSQIDSL